VYKLRFIQKLHDTMNEINSMYYAAKEVKDSREWIDILKVVLELGNVLNYGSFRAGAWGFKLNALTKLKETKSDNKDLKEYTVLLQLCKILKRDFPHLAKFYSHLPHVEAASTCSLQQANAVVSALKNGLLEAKKINRQVSPINEIDNFKKLMSKFLSRASDEVEALEDLFEKTEKKYNELATFYAEDPAKLSAEEFFKMIATFISDVKDGYKIMNAQKKAAESKARIEANRAARMAEQEEKNEEEGVHVHKGKSKGGKSPRVARGAAEDAVAGLDLDALMSGGGEKKKKKKKKKDNSDDEEEEEVVEKKEKKSRRRKVGKDEALAAAAGIDLDSFLK
jgi:formin 2